MDSKAILLKRWTVLMVVATLVLIICCMVPGLQYLALEVTIGCGLVCTVWMAVLTYAVADKSKCLSY